MKNLKADAIMDRESGEGIIITSTSNIPFTDRLGDEKHPFYKLFFWFLGCYSNIFVGD